MKKKLSFKVSTGIKSIVGADLINDDLIAIFELVKNCFDAHATKVTIEFKNLYSGNAKILIKDDGKGMDYEDLTEKWLFLAYSAKKDMTEDDYRSNILPNKSYAGSKGIGRFSCDRLGRNLYLETKKMGSNASVEVLEIDWNKFDVDQKQEFGSIELDHSSSGNGRYLSAHGTVLEISDLKEEWNRTKLLRLKAELAKLIYPLDNENFLDTFRIEIKVDEDIATDGEKNDYEDKVNGSVQNKIFSVLDLKTSKITCRTIGEKSEEIEFSLFEGGRLVYKLIEKNQYSSLKHVGLDLYFLNASAKSTFTRRMGTQPINYGHVFVYKNGFRIYPYGIRGEDPLHMDVRKSQGKTRYLGTREVIGFIKIDGPNDELVETSSRGDGLKKSQAYYDLNEWFYQSLRRLEKFTISIVDWGKDLSIDEYVRLDDNKKKAAITKLIANLSRSKDIVEFEVSPEILEILESKAKKTGSTRIKAIEAKIIGGNFDRKDILSDLKKTGDEFDRLAREKDEAETEAIESFIEGDRLASKLESEIKKGAFKGALLGTDRERIISLQHQIYHSSSRINQNIKNLISHIGKENLDSKTKKYIKIMSLESSKINAIANFVTKANFNLKASSVEMDLISFIGDYLEEMYIGVSSTLNADLKIKVIGADKQFIVKIRPLIFTMVIDNFITNAENAGASELVFAFTISRSRLTLEITDDGCGIASESLKEIFNMGESSTRGSGIGLFQVHDELVGHYKAELEVLSELTIGTTFRIKFNEVKL